MNAYEVLGVNSNATDDEIRDRYRKLMMQVHSDATISENLTEDALRKNEERAKQYNAAYELLKKGKRREYDKSLKEEQSTIHPHNASRNTSQSYSTYYGFNNEVNFDNWMNTSQNRETILEREIINLSSQKEYQERYLERKKIEISSEIHKSFSGQINTILSKTGQIRGQISQLEYLKEKSIRALYNEFMSSKSRIFMLPRKEQELIQRYNDEVKKVDREYDPQIEELNRKLEDLTKQMNEIEQKKQEAVMKHPSIVEITNKISSLQTQIDACALELDGLYSQKASGKGM